MSGLIVLVSFVIIMTLILKAPNTDERFKRMLIAIVGFVTGVIIQTLR